MTEVVNLTTHPITDTMTGITYQPSGIVARADTKKNLVSKPGEPAIYEYTAINLDGLPEPNEGRDGLRPKLVNVLPLGELLERAELDVF